MRHTLSILVENQFGVLVRIAGMFSGRGFNIDTLNVAPSLDASTSRLTIVVRGDDKILDQVSKQLAKLVNVLSVDDLSDESPQHRELILLRVKNEASTQDDIIKLCEGFSAKVIEQQPTSLAIEITDAEDNINNFLEVMKPFGIIDLTRTGRLALPRTA